MFKILAATLLLAFREVANVDFPTALSILLLAFGIDEIISKKK